MYPFSQTMLVLSVHTLQLVLTSPPSHPPTLSNSLLHQLPVTLATELQGADLSKYCQWWSAVHQFISTSTRYMCIILCLYKSYNVELFLK